MIQKKTLERLTRPCQVLNRFTGTSVDATRLKDCGAQEWGFISGQRPRGQNINASLAKVRYT